jgi:hypothetical protein
VGLLKFLRFIKNIFQYQISVIIIIIVNLLKYIRDKQAQFDNEKIVSLNKQLWFMIEHSLS